MPRASARRSERDAMTVSRQYAVLPAAARGRRARAHRAARVPDHRAVSRADRLGAVSRFPAAAGAGTAHEVAARPRIDLGILVDDPRPAPVPRSDDGARGRIRPAGRGSREPAAGLDRAAAGARLLAIDRDPGRRRCAGLAGTERADQHGTRAGLGRGRQQAPVRAARAPSAASRSSAPSARCWHSR